MVLVVICICLLPLDWDGIWIVAGRGLESCYEGTNKEGSNAVKGRAAESVAGQQLTVMSIVLRIRHCDACRWRRIVAWRCAKESQTLSCCQGCHSGVWIRFCH